MILRCKTAITTDDVEDWLYLQLEDNTHLLHAVVHSNGFGHLLTLNGRQGGSKLLSGRQVMDFWDRLCQTLAVRFGTLNLRIGLKYLNIYMYPVLFYSIAFCLIGRLA